MAKPGRFSPMLIIYTRVSFIANKSSRWYSGLDRTESCPLKTNPWVYALLVFDHNPEHFIIQKVLLGRHAVSHAQYSCIQHFNYCTASVTIQQCFFSKTIVGFWKTFNILDGNLEIFQDFEKTLKILSIFHEFFMISKNNSKNLQNFEEKKHCYSDAYRMKTGHVC